MNKIIHRNSFIQFFIILTITLFSSQMVFAQSPHDSLIQLKGSTVIAASFRYQNLPDDLDIMYFGFLFENYLGDKFSISAPIYLGKGSHDLTYIHFPMGGLLTVFIIKIIMGDFLDVSGLSEPGSIKFLLTENINYNIRVKNKLIIAPYISFLGLDGSSSNENSENAARSYLSNGLGLQVKTWLNENWTICSSVDYKHFIGDKIESNNHFGYGAAISIGYMF